MKTITATLILITSLLFSYSLISGVMAEQDYRHCLMMNIDLLITDDEIARLVHTCEQKTGYKVNPELLP